MARPFLASRQVVFDSRFGWNEPTRAADLIVRVPGTSTASRRARGRLAVHRPPDHWLADWRAADEAATRAVAPSCSTSRPDRARTCSARSPRLYADGDLVYTASSMPIRDQEAFLPGDAGRRALPRQPWRERHRRADLFWDRRRARHRPAGLDRHRRPRGVHDMNALALVRGPDAPMRIVVVNNDGGGIFELLPQARQLEPRRVRGRVRHPGGIDLVHAAAAHGIAVHAGRDPHRAAGRRRRVRPDRGAGQPRLDRRAAPPAQRRGKRRRRPRPRLKVPGTRFEDSGSPRRSAAAASRRA